MVPRRISHQNAVLLYGLIILWGMEIRAATSDDGAAIREVARASLTASYPLSPGTIDAAVEAWYDQEALADKVDRDEAMFMVATVEGEVVGFVEGVKTEGEPTGDILWLHVHPDHRGGGIGSTLFDRARRELYGMGATQLRGLVLAVNSEGNDFYEEHGFRQVGTHKAEIDDETFFENIYHESDPPDLHPIGTEDGVRYLDRSDSDRGSIAPFHVVYSDPEREKTYGYFCSNCESLATAMDAMGRVECNDCGNARKPTRWDSAYM